MLTSGSQYLGRLEVYFLCELGAGGLERRLAVDVQKARAGELPVALANRVPVLLDQQHPAVLIHRQHRDRPRVVDVLRGRSSPSVVGGTVSRRMSQTAPWNGIAGEQGRDRTARHASCAIDRLRAVSAAAPRRPVALEQRRLGPADAPAQRRPVRGTADARRLGPRSKLGVRLGADVVGVHLARQFDVLDQVADPATVPENTRPGLFELCRGSALFTS